MGWVLASKPTQIYYRLSWTNAIRLPKGLNIYDVYVSEIYFYSVNEAQSYRNIWCKFGEPRNLGCTINVK